MLLNNFVPTFVPTYLGTLFLLILLNNTCLSPYQWRGRGDFSSCIYKGIEKTTVIFHKFRKLIWHQIGGDKDGDNFLKGLFDSKKGSFFFLPRSRFFFSAANSPFIASAGDFDVDDTISAGPSRNLLSIRLPQAPKSCPVNF